MAASLLQKFVLILAFFVMMAATANAGAFLTDGGVAQNSITINGKTYNVSNLSRSDSNQNYHDRDNDSTNDKDLWYDGPYEDPGPHEYNTYLDYDSLFSDGIGYTYNNDLSDKDYTGYYIGTFSGNESQIDLENLIRYFFDFPEIDFLGWAKYDYVSQDDGDLYNDSYKLDVSIDEFADFDDGAPRTGSWSVIDSNEQDHAISFYSVKGSNEYALYYVDPSQHEGQWTTAHLSAGSNNNIPGISHFSVVSSDVVPEPATMILFGMGLMGLAGIGRRAWQK